MNRSAETDSKFVDVTSLVQQAWEQFPDPVYVSSLDARGLVYLNPAFEAATGFTLGELQSLGLEGSLARIHPDDRQAYLAGLCEFMQQADQREGNAYQTCQYRWQCKDGTYRWFATNYALIRNAQGHPHALVGTMRDITSHHETEQARRAGEARLREVLENSQDMIYRRNLLTGYYDYVSPSSVAVVGFTPQEMMAMTYEERLARCHPDDRERYLAQNEILESSTETGSDAPANVLEHRWKTKSGEYRWLSLNRRLVRDAQGRPIAHVGSIRDVTAQKLAEQRLAELNETLEQRVEQRTAQVRALAAELSRAEERERQRVARVLHDQLQQLLVAAQMHASTLRRHLKEGSLCHVAQRIDEVLNEAIKTSRSLTAELSPPVLYDAGLAPALHWLAHWVEENHGLHVDIDAEDLGNRPDEGVRTTLFQAVRELLFNVVKHAGVSQATVRLRRLPEDNLELVVGDMGRGMNLTDAVLADGGTLSEGAASLEGAASTEGAASLEGAALAQGSGLGLFSIRERLRLMGGHMQVQSARGQGVRVILRAPLRSPQGETITQMTAMRQQPAGRTNRARSERAEARRVRVLLADDHAIVRQGLALLLEAESGIELVGQAKNGEEVVELARTTHPDVILMDVSMPGMDGLKATRHILAEQPDIKIIGLSMYEGDLMAEHLRRAGAVGYVPKGGDPADLLDAIWRAVSDRPEEE